ncbi:MAG: hypothetical protein HQ521_01455 [Bacteroidetes bacterium]|nr:hypothetical protein [Bacteroidota bacterium]
MFRRQGNGNIFCIRDGVVSADTQNIANIHYFQEEKTLVEAYNIENVGHLEECWNYKTIVEAQGKGYLFKKQEFIENHKEELIN